MSWLKHLFGGGRRVEEPRIRRVDADIAFDVYLLGTAVLPTNDLVRDFPPILSHPNKQLLFERAKDGPPAGGELVVSRFSQMPLPDPDSHRATVTTQPGVFDYKTPTDWYLNFAHHDLFCSYGAFIFAQDEHQVAEHPALASLREALRLRDDAVQPTTRDRTGATPVLIQGVERRLRIDTVIEGHGSIYGARFGEASASAVRAAAHAMQPPTTSSILAIEAPIATRAGGRYDSLHIEDALCTAYSGFRSAVLLDHRQGRSTIVHTGYWGCGAYGGDPGLMTMIQLFAAHLAGVSEVVFHTADRDPAQVERAHHRLITEFYAPTTRAVIGKLARAGFTWGTPDGN